MKLNKQRLMELAGVNNALNEGYAWEREEGGALPTLASSTEKHNASMSNESVDTVAAASEMLSLLAHPDMKRNMDALSDQVDDQQFMAIKKLYDQLYAELKKYE